MIPVYRDALEMTGQVHGAQLSEELPGRGFCCRSVHE